MSTDTKEYLGDGVYASLDGLGQIWLSLADSEIRHPCAIALEPAVLVELLNYARRHCVIKDHR